MRITNSNERSYINKAGSMKRLSSQEELRIAMKICAYSRRLLLRLTSIESVVRKLIPYLEQVASHTIRIDTPFNLHIEDVEAKERIRKILPLHLSTLKNILSSTSSCLDLKCKQIGRSRWNFIHRPN